MSGLTVAMTQATAYAKGASPAVGKGAYLRLVPIVLIFYAALLPLEMRIVVADQALYAPRIAGFAMLPWLLAQAASQSIRF